MREIYIDDEFLPAHAPSKRGTANHFNSINSSGKVAVDNQEPRPIPTTWTREKVFSSEGLYLLADVCRYLPFTPKEILRISRNQTASPSTSGITYFSKKVVGVDLHLFIPWAAKVWLGEEGFQKRLRKGRRDV